jgi:hypothetical protein
MSKYLLGLLILTGCTGTQVPVVPPPAPVETFCQMLYRTENVTCDELRSHQEGDDLPDVQRIYDALVRGRNRAAGIYPNVADIKFARVSLYRPQRYYDVFPTRPWPLIIGWHDYTTDMDVYIRGIFYPETMSINYSYEEVLEHEIIHALVYLATDTLIERLPEFITPASPEQYLFQVTCHGTVDDPFTRDGDTSACIAPLSSR